MRLSHFAPKIGLALLLSTGCNDGQTANEKDTDSSLIKTCTRNCDTDANGTNPFWQPDGPKSSFTMHSPEWPLGSDYMVTGFVKGPTAEWIVRGYQVVPGPLNPIYTNYDGTVTLRTSDGVSHTIIGMDGQPNVPTAAITYCEDKLCMVKAQVEGNDLIKVKLDLVLPGPGGRNSAYFTWTFVDKFLTPSVPPVTEKWKEDASQGIMVNWETKGVAPSALCKGAGGTPQLIVPQGGFTYNPTNFERYLNPQALTWACETGAIAECAGWGYSSAYKAALMSGGDADMELQGYRCVQMKTANYCKDGAIHTIVGTKIMISDPLDPVRNKDFGYPEAIWTENGAVCIDPTGLRHPEFPLGCAIPTCTPKDWMAYQTSLFISGTPH